MNVRNERGGAAAILAFIVLAMVVVVGLGATIVTSTSATARLSVQQASGSAVRGTVDLLAAKMNRVGLQAVVAEIEAEGGFGEYSLLSFPGTTANSGEVIVTSLERDGNDVHVGLLVRSDGIITVENDVTAVLSPTGYAAITGSSVSGARWAYCETEIACPSGPLGIWSPTSIDAGGTP